MSQSTITSAVQQQYGASARSGLSSNDASVRAVANAFGYSDAELNSIPAEANLGLSCGNPTAFASVVPGEVVVDLGSGGGLDVFLIAQRVGPAGRAIGIDMTPDMIRIASENAAKAGLTNVEFHLAQIDATGLPASSIDCVISNCVVNLAPDKHAVFREMARILKPGGRVAISDIALKQVLPKELENSLEAYVGCFGGAIPISEYINGLTNAGFVAVDVVDSHSDLNAYAKVDGQSGCCSPANVSQQIASPAAGGLSILSAGQCCSGDSTCSDDSPRNAAPSAEDRTVHAGLAELLSRYDINEYAASVKVMAVR